MVELYTKTDVTDFHERKKNQLRVITFYVSSCVYMLVTVCLRVSVSVCRCFGVSVCLSVCLVSLCVSYVSVSIYIGSGIISPTEHYTMVSKMQKTTLHTVADA